MRPVVHSIRRQLTRTLTLAISGLLAIGLVLVYVAQREALTEQFDDTLLAQAEMLNHAAAAGGDALARLAILPGSPPEAGPKPKEFYEIRRADGTLAFRSRSLGRAELERRPLRPTQPTFWPLTLPTGRRGRAVGVVFPSVAAGAEGQQIIFAGARDELDEALRSSLAAVAAGGLLLILATVLLVPRLLRRALQPLDAFAAQVAQIDARNLGVRVATAEAPDELQPVAARLNDLLTRLEGSFERERRVSADLAHELRTPVAELRILAESALKWPATRDPATDRDALAIAAQLESLIERMLALARSEGGRLALTPAAVELPAMLEGAWKSFAPRAADRGVTVTFALSSTVVVTDAVLLRSIVTNLFDNAVDYTPAGGEIRIACAAVPAGGVELRVTNTTEHLAPEDVDRLFERFWRKEAARVTGVHVGLGLALVQSFATALGWEASAALGEQRRLTVTLRGKNLPAGGA